jgi:hypothetical protein
LWAEGKKKKTQTQSPILSMFYAEKAEIPGEQQAIVPWCLLFLASIAEMQNVGQFYCNVSFF